jgi:hypothetical protein
MIAKDHPPRGNAMNKTLPLSRSLLITSLVALGIAAAWFMAAAWLTNTVQRVTQSRDSYENIHVTVTGDPVIVRTSQGNSQTTEKILSLSGEPVKVKSQDLLYPQAIEAPNRARVILQRPEWQARLAEANDGGIPPIYWYMIHDGQSPGHAYGIGYHSTTRTVVAYFGRSGFRDSLPPRDDWFAIAGHSGMQGASTLEFYGQEPQWMMSSPLALLLADGKLWKIDFANRQVAKILDCPEAFALGQVWRILPELPPQSLQGEDWSAQSITPSDALLREPESLLIVNRRSGESRRFVLPPELQKQMLAGSLLPDGRLLLTAQQDWTDSDIDVVWLTATGQIDKQQVVHQKTHYQRPSLAATGWTSALSAPWPLANAAITFAGLPNTLGQFAVEDQDLDYQAALAKVLWNTWPSILTVTALGCIVAPLAYRRQKRFGLPNPAAWAAFAFIFGLPGFLAYRFHRVWPVLEECPACHQASPRDREACLDCGKLFPPPPLKGIEVFA